MKQGDSTEHKKQSDFSYEEELERLAKIRRRINIAQLIVAFMSLAVSIAMPLIIFYFCR